MEPLQVPTALGTPPSTETTPTSSRITTTMGTMAHNVIEDIYGAFPPPPHVSLELPYETNNAEHESRNEFGLHNFEGEALEAWDELSDSTPRAAPYFEIKQRHQSTGHHLAASTPRYIRIQPINIPSIFSVLNLYYKALHVKRQPILLSFIVGF